jgi:antibiotic biosynthesis monooxygenase (ABM) superfamily enzyme
MKNPPKWKFAIMVWIAIYPSITLVQFLIGDSLLELPVPIRSLILTLILVPLMVFVLLPGLRKILNNWLHN